MKSLRRTLAPQLGARRRTTSLAALMVMLTACAAPPVTAPAEPPAPARVAVPATLPVPAAPTANASAPGAAGAELGRNERVLVYLPVAGDTWAGVAARFLGPGRHAWEIADANGGMTADAGAAPAAGAVAGTSAGTGAGTGAGPWAPMAGRPLVVPLLPSHPYGVLADGVQTVPVLCYHRFGSGPSKMIVSPAQFDAQLEWLAKNQYQVISLDALAAFLAGRSALPRRSVVITIDDGYESVHRHAFPALKKHGFTATLFVYTDFVGARDALSWAQLQEMASSGVMDIQAHSKSHRNLVERMAGESEAAYRQNIENELRQPRNALERRLAGVGVRVRHFAFPFGDANESVLQSLQQQKYELGVTVNAGGNAFYADPLMLRRTMIFGDHTLEDFKSKLQLRRGSSRP